MKSIFSNEIFILLIRILLGSIFVVAGLDKIGDTAAFAESILNYKIIGSTLAIFSVTVLPSLELVCGLCLILGLYSRASTIIITTMLVIFTLLVASALFRGLDISCGCFTQDPVAGKIGFKKILENLGMIILGVYLLSIKNYGFSILHLLHWKEDSANHKV